MVHDEARPAPPDGGAPTVASKVQHAGAERVIGRHGGVLKRTALISVLTLASRILGFVREVLSAILFGDRSAIFDAFLTAWRVPNLFRRFFGEGALSTSLQTALVKEDTERGDAAGRALFHATLWRTSWILLAACLVAALGLQLLRPYVGLGFLGDEVSALAAIELSVRLLPFVPLICLAALTAGALQVRGHYASPALAPVAMNMGWIAVLAVLLLVARGAEPIDQARWLAWGVLAAGSLQLFVQLPALRRHGLWGRGPDEAAPEQGSGPGKSSAADVLRRAAPLALGAAVYQINVMIDGLMAKGLLADGGATAHYFANRVQQFPLALIAIAATSAVFPKLKALAQVGRRHELRELHDRTQAAIAFLALPASAGLLALSPWVSAALFQHGNYGAEGVDRLAGALSMLSLALLPAGAVGLTSRLYYALDDFRHPVRVSIGMLALNTGLNVLFVMVLGMDVEGLALATACSSWMNLALLLPGLHGQLGLPPARPGDVGHLPRILVAAVVTGVVAQATARLVELVVPEDLGPGLSAALILVPAMLAGGLGLALAAQALGLPEWRALKRRLAGRRGGLPGA